MSTGQDGTGKIPNVTSSPSNMSEEAFLGLESKRPMGSIRKPGGRSRPSDITITEPTSLNNRDQVHQDTTSGSLRQAAMTPRRSSSPFATGASPSPAYQRASISPRHLSPATSQIFERDVQESTLAPELSPAIPSHIQTEDHIPPVLEASSEIITNNRVDPEDVEVVTHSMHQPAAMMGHSAGAGDASPAPQTSDTQLAVPMQDTAEDAGSTYGAVDPADPRRLSFISFADVVHAEHVETGKEMPTHLMSPASMGPTPQHGRSPSPVRSLMSDRPPLSPPMSGSGSMMGVEASPSRGGPGSISSGHAGGQHGELTIHTMKETMEQSGSSEAGPPGTPV